MGWGCRVVIMKRSIYKTALEIARNAIRRTNWEGSSDCREYYFSDDEVAQYLTECFYKKDLLDIYKRSKDGETILIKELCCEYLNSSFNNCGYYFELYFNIGTGAEQETYCLYSQYDAEYDKEYCI